MKLPKHIRKMTREETVSEIVLLNKKITEFWKSSSGWSPIDAAELLSKSRLDRQVSLSKSLILWEEPKDEGMSDGMLILAWANLGALVEGSLKWFLSVYFEDYKNDVNKLKKDPDGVTLNPLRLYFKKSVWTENDDYDEWVLSAQTHRNSIHAYQDKNIGDWQGYHLKVKEYLVFLSNLDSRVPYPDEMQYDCT